MHDETKPHKTCLFFSRSNPLKVTGEFEIESLGRVHEGELGGAKPVSFLLVILFGYKPTQTACTSPLSVKQPSS